MAGVVVVVRLVLVPIEGEVAELVPGPIVGEVVEGSCSLQGYISVRGNCLSSDRTHRSQT